MNTSSTFSTNQVADIARVSNRQLQWWDERRVVQPRHEGHRRVYEAEEALDIVVIAELRRKGCSLQAIRRVLRAMQRQIHTAVANALAGMGGYLVEGLSHVLVVSPNGKSVAVFDDSDKALRFLIQQKNPHVVISLSAAIRAIRDHKPDPPKSKARRAWLT